MKWSPFWYKMAQIQEPSNIDVTSAATAAVADITESSENLCGVWFWLLFLHKFLNEPYRLIWAHFGPATSRKVIVFYGGLDNPLQKIASPISWLSQLAICSVFSLWPPGLLFGPFGCFLCTPSQCLNLGELISCFFFCQDLFWPNLFLRKRAESWSSWPSTDLLAVWRRAVDLLKEQLLSFCWPPSGLQLVFF